MVEELYIDCTRQQALRKHGGKRPHTQSHEQQVPSSEDVRLNGIDENTAVLEDVRFQVGLRRPATIHCREGKLMEVEVILAKRFSGIG